MPSGMNGTGIHSVLNLKVFYRESEPSCGRWDVRACKHVKPPNEHIPGRQKRHIPSGQNSFSL
jgi:hypothetical protein